MGTVVTMDYAKLVKRVRREVEEVREGRNEREVLQLSEHERRIVMSEIPAPVKLELLPL